MMSAEKHMPKVIIVSNRLPVSVKKEKGQLKFFPSVGGLATGLASYTNDKKNIWIGWPGIASDSLSDAEKQQIVKELAKHNCSPVWLTQRQIKDYYNGYSNSVLWPIFHSLSRRTIPSSEYARWWQAYKRVNEKFAEATLNRAETKTRIWIHDYQLLLVPQLLRKARKELNLGFFLHIPFPTNRTMNKLSEHKKLLEGILGANLVGLHTPGYVTNFLDSTQSSGLVKVENYEAIYDDRVVQIRDFPMGIDFTKYSTANKTSAVKKAVRNYKNMYRHKKVIVSVDRLDPSKGLLERLKAYDLFLSRNPRRHGKIIFAMVAAPSRTDVPAYQKLSEKLEQLASEINNKYGNARWQPVDYINQSLPFEEVAALFQVADVAFIAPLRDGMNLVAKEFVASAHKHGVLILSSTAGASEELKDALIVNPRKPETLVAALDQALNMRRRELRRRLKKMRQQLATNTVQDWAKDFVNTLQQPVPGTPVITKPLRGRFHKNLIKDYAKSAQRLLLLDYDGTLMPFYEDYHKTTPPKSLTQLLIKLTSDPKNQVVMISGRKPADLEQWFGDIPISLVAEHGASIKKAGNKNWKIIEKPDVKWKKTLEPILQKYSELTPKSRIEHKPHTLVWHYRGSPPYQAQKYAVTIKRVLKPYLREFSLELLQGNKVLEIKNPQISKGKATHTWLSRDHDFVLGLGDDLTDEELFTALPDSAYSIKVGRGRTIAQYRLRDYIAVRALLTKLSKS